MSNFTHEALRYVLVLVTMPLWMPFVKSLWKELNRALRYEGGLFGKRPTPQEAREIERAAMREENPLVHEPIARPGAGGRPRFRQNPRSPGTGAQRAAPRAGATGSALGAPRPTLGARPSTRSGGFR